MTINEEAMKMLQAILEKGYGFAELKKESEEQEKRENLYDWQKTGLTRP